MKLLRKLIKILIILVLTSPIWFPITVLVFAYKSYEPPLETYESVSMPPSFTDIAENSLNAFLSSDPDEQTEKIDFVMSQDEGNLAIYSMFLEQNPHYLSDDETIDEAERNYAIGFEGNGGVKGATILFNEGGLSLEVGADARIGGFFTYKTTIFMNFGIEAQDGVYTLKLRNISVGNMPFLWMYDVANWAFGFGFDGGLNTLINDSIPFGTFDGSTRTIAITSQDIVDLIAPEGNENRSMITALLGFIEEEELLEFTFGDNHGGLSLDLRKMTSTDEGYALNYRLENDDDVSQMFENQLSSLLISSLFNPDGGLSFDMHEHAFNQLMDYYVGETMSIEQQLQVGSSTYTLATQPLFSRFRNNRVELTVILTLQNDATLDTFQTHFTLITTPSIRQQDLVFTVDAVQIGDSLSVSNDNIRLIMDLIGENSIVNGNDIVVEDFLNEIVAQGFSIDAVVVRNTYIRFSVTPTTASQIEAINDLQNALGGALGNVLTNPAYEDVSAAYDDYLNNDGSAQDVLDAINGLDPDDQHTFFNNLSDTLEDDVDLSLLLP